MTDEMHFATQRFPFSSDCGSAYLFMLWSRE